MCTALTYQNGDFYFGRNLDLEVGFNQSVAITPRNYSFVRANGEKILTHYALIGMATVFEGYPLYADASNEYGLSMAGLNFPQNAKYAPYNKDKDNIAPYEFILVVLSTCKDLKEAKQLLENLNLYEATYQSFPLAPLHFIISDKSGSLVVESQSDGLHIYDNPFGILTNNPPFYYHLENVKNYMGLKAQNAANTLSDKLDLRTYCEGMGALGLPGDASSPSRFIKALFHKFTSKNEPSEEANLSQFMYILDSVKMIKGSVITENDHHDITLYSSCINTTKGIYYYKTYDNPTLRAIDMSKEDLDTDKVITYGLDRPYYIDHQN